MTVIIPLLKCQLALAQSDYAEVVNHANEFIHILENSGVHVGLADAYLYKAQGLLAQERYDLARQALTRADQIAEKLQARRIHWKILLALSDLEVRDNNEDKALQLRKDARRMLEYVVEHIPNREAQTSFVSLLQVSKLLSPNRL